MPKSIRVFWELAGSTVVTVDDDFDCESFDDKEVLELIDWQHALNDTTREVVDMIEEVKAR